MVENRQFSSVRCIVKVITLDNQHIKTHSKYMELTRNPGKRLQASRDWFWFYFLFNSKEVTRAYFKSVAERPAQTQKMRMKFLSTCTQVNIAIPEKVNSFIPICGRFIVKLC